MAQETRDRIVTVLSGIPIDPGDVDGSRSIRVAVAIIMVMTSPDYVVLR